LLAQRAVGVGLVERRLLQEVLAQQLRGAQHDLLLGRQRVRAEQLDDFQQGAFLLQDVERPVALPRPGLRHDVAEPVGQLIEGVAAPPVHGGEMPCPGQVAVKCPEGAGHPQRVLRYRLRKVAAGR